MTQSDPRVAGPCRRTLTPVSTSERAGRAEQAGRLARGAADWLLRGPDSRTDDPSLYHGQAGVILALEEAYRHLGDERYRRAAITGRDALAETVAQLEDSSLYFGLAGIAGALRALERPAEARSALARIRDRFDGQRWNPMFELLIGNAGIGLGALWAGDIDLAVTAVTP